MHIDSVRYPFRLKISSVYSCHIQVVHYTSLFCFLSDDYSCLCAREWTAKWVVSMDASGKCVLGGIILWLLSSVQCDQCLHLHLFIMEISTEYFQWSRRMGFPHFLWFDCLGRVLPQCPGLQTANLPSVLTLGYLLPLSLEQSSFVPKETAS